MERFCFKWGPRTFIDRALHAPLSNTVCVSCFSIALIRYMTKSDLGRSWFCLGFHHCREFVWERWPQAGDTVSGSGSWELTPQPQAQREQTEDGAGQGTLKPLSSDTLPVRPHLLNLSKQHQHQMLEFKMPESVGDISNHCTMSPRSFRVNIIPSHVDFTGS